MLSDGNQIHSTFELSDKHKVVMTSPETGKHRKHYGNLLRPPTNLIEVNRTPDNETSKEHIIALSKTQKQTKPSFFQVVSDITSVPLNTTSLFLFVRG